MRFYKSDKSTVLPQFQVTHLLFAPNKLESSPVSYQFKTLTKTQNFQFTLPPTNQSGVEVFHVCCERTLVYLSTDPATLKLE